MPFSSKPPPCYMTQEKRPEKERAELRMSELG